MDVRRRSQLGQLGSVGKDSINIDNYLTIEALEDGLTASLSTNAVEYCVDGDGEWKSLAAGTTTESINTGQTLSFRGNLTPTSSNGIGTFTISKNCNLKGNVMSLLFGDNAADNFSLSGKNYAFYRLFSHCATIINANDLSLPANIITIDCYRYMFFCCTNLTTAPILPATTLAPQCYYSMFYCCTSLTTAPELPATTLASSCYFSMFEGCTSLTTVPALPATTLAEYCYMYMFQHCSNLTTVPELPATTMLRCCYNYMFYNCSNLTTAPELPATTLADYCYQYMFYNCSKLNYIKMLATNISANKCLNKWVSGVSSTGTFVKNAAMTSLPTGTSGIPSGWTVVNDGEDNLITFTIGGIEYQAEDGMTWEEWINSEYNPILPDDFPINSLIGKPTFYIESNGTIIKRNSSGIHSPVADNNDIYIVSTTLIYKNDEFFLININMGQ